MSVALLVTPRRGNSEASRLVPVATQDMFTTIWKPAAERLGLRWIPLFEGGTTVERDDLPDVLRELGVLRNWCVSSDSARELILGRIERLIAELQQILSTNDDVEVFIG